MLRELKYQEFESVRPLFDGFDYSLSIRAVLDGSNPGRIFADDPRDPRLAFALTIEGYLLAGDHSNPVRREAAERGWSDVDHVIHDEDFQFLHGLPVWHRIVARIQKNKGN